jgi:hypothetical protein
MNRLFFSLLLLAGVGCTSVQPVGPMAHLMKTKAEPAGPAGPAATPPDPITMQPQRPVPPAILIVPEEVTPDNASSATRKLLDEYEHDRKTIPQTSTAEVSIIKGGVKQN